MLRACRRLPLGERRDHSSADPHGQNQIVNNAINGQVLRTLVKRDRKLDVIPARRELVAGLAHRVALQAAQGREVHDGSAFTADDVVFSIKRSAGDTSTFRVYGRAAGEPRKVTTTPVDW
jgi:peptide/nickel transport system substrate-binding protein